jgi:hypothetical protein
MNVLCCVISFATMGLFLQLTAIRDNEIKQTNTKFFEYRYSVPQIGINYPLFVSMLAVQTDSNWELDHFKEHGTRNGPFCFLSFRVSFTPRLMETLWVGSVIASATQTFTVTKFRTSVTQLRSCSRKRICVCLLYERSRS